MATVHRTKKTGQTRIQFFDADGERRTIYLGRCPKSVANRIGLHLDALVAATMGNVALDPDQAAWLRGVRPRLREQLEKVGLVECVAPTVPRTLNAFVDWYITLRVGSDVKPATVTVWRRTQKHLVRIFGADKPLQDFTTGDAKDFRRKLLQGGMSARTKTGLAENTVRRTCGIAKQFFAEAVDRRIMGSNPFVHRDVPCQTTGNEKRFAFLDQDRTEKVLEALPDAQWRLIFALCRYGGLRCPSEVLRLKWADVDLVEGRITVHASKTEHHAGKGTRTMPLFPELRPYLLEAFDPEAVHCVTRYRVAGTNLRTQFLRYLSGASIDPWPKLFQNLRSTRQTELEEQFPSHVVCAWLGNSVRVAKAHYLQVTDDHFAKALDPVAQNLSATAGTHVATRKEPCGNPAETAGILPQPAMGRNKVGVTGLEPVTSSV